MKYSIPSKVDMEYVNTKSARTTTTATTKTENKKITLAISNPALTYS